MENSAQNTVKNTVKLHRYKSAIRYDVYKIQWVIARWWCRTYGTQFVS